MVAVGCALLVLVGVPGGDYLLLAARLNHVHVKFPRTHDGPTWLVVGSDSRADLPSGRNVYGTIRSEPGAHADVVLLIHRYRGHYHVLSVPRDLLVSPAVGVVNRLTLTFMSGAQGVVDGLCRSVGVAATRLVVVTMSGLASIVDDLGGVSVDIRHPVSDRLSGLDIARAGRQTLNGATALALVRSRHPITVVDGRQVRASLGAGAHMRTTSAGLVFASIARAARSARWNPLTVQQTLWSLTDSLTTDQNTSLWDLHQLADVSGPFEDLPVQSQADGLVLSPDAATTAALRADGMSGTCDPRGLSGPSGPG